MSRYHLFEVFGIEIEYMLVDATTLDVRPVAPLVLVDAEGETRNELEDGPISWSNELAAHVVELKTTEPAPTLDGLSDAFHASLGRLKRRLPEGIALLPGAAHPWMDPDREFVRWVDADAEIYATFDRIFDCRGHGWSNLQSIHVNLPFSGDEEFHRLHAAIRLVLPLIPALSAASPVLGGALQPELDVRMRYYATNARRIPEMTGRVVPEPVTSRADYGRVILEPLYRALAPHDPAKILREEWANARGAIARFDRDAIEIRVIDAQECPRMDLAVATAVVAAVRDRVEAEVHALRPFETERLARILDRTMATADATTIDDPEYLAQMGLPQTPTTAREAWRSLLERTSATDADAPEAEALALLVDRGPLARRLVAALPESPSREDLAAVWRQMAACLDANVPFRTP